MISMDYRGSRVDTPPLRARSSIDSSLNAVSVNPEMPEVVIGREGGEGILIILHDIVI